MKSSGRRGARLLRLAPATGLISVAVLAVGAPTVATTAPSDPSPPVSEPPTTTSLTLTLDPPAVEFGNTPAGTTSDAAVVELIVSGGAVDDLTFELEGPFTVDEDCGEMNDGDSCQIEVRFVPMGPGVAGGQLLVRSGAASVGASLGGTGTAPIPTSPSITTIPPNTTVPPPTATVPSTDPTTGDPDESRDECDARALGAEIRYAPSLEMRVGESVSIVATASIGDGAPGSSVAGPSTTVIPQPLRCQVRARLLGGDDFSTNPGDWQEASFLGTTEVTWRWVVTPRLVGDDLFLILEVQGLRFDTEAGDYRPAGDSFQEEARISVDSRPQGVVSRLNDAVSGVVTHPLVAFAGVGGLVVVFRWALQRRNKGTPADE